MAAEHRSARETPDPHLRDAVMRAVSAYADSGYDAAVRQQLRAELGLTNDSAGEALQELLRASPREAGAYHVPKLVLDLVSKLLEGMSPDRVLDPWAGMGVLLSHVCARTHPASAFALVATSREQDVGRFVLPSAEWLALGPDTLLDSLCADPLVLPLGASFTEDSRAILDPLRGGVDLVVSILPMGIRGPQSVSVQASDGTQLTLRGELGHRLLVASSLRLKADGLGLFVVAESFFSRRDSPWLMLAQLGLGVESAFALPAGAWPSAPIGSYLLVVRRKPVPRMFVAEVSADAHRTDLILANRRATKEGAIPELGRFVEPSSFSGLASLKLQERTAEAEARFAAPAQRLGELACEIHRGRSTPNFSFPEAANCLFIPRHGSRDVVFSAANMKTKPQNYAQVVLRPELTDARFVASFFNSELGKDIRAASRTGCISDLPVLIPDIETQRKVLDAESLIAAQRSALLDIEAEVAACERDLWANPGESDRVATRIAALSAIMGGRQDESPRLEDWAETIPFPLASILRAWLATPSDDLKAKYEHLLDFLEAQAEFVGVVLLSAFCSSEELYQSIRAGLGKALGEQRFSLERPAFGTWRTVTEYLGKHIRKLLNGDAESGPAIVAEMFADDSRELPKMVSSKELCKVLADANKMRNDWKGHGGVVGPDTARFRHDELLKQVQRVQLVTGDVWSRTHLVNATRLVHRRDLFENQVALLMGSNPTFEQKTLALGMPLDVERLYLVRVDQTKAMLLQPFLVMGPSPPDARNACYFYNRSEGQLARFVSYHFTDKPETEVSLNDRPEFVKLLSLS